MKTFALNTLLVLATVTVTLVALELGLRGYYLGSLANPGFAGPSFMIPHPTRGFAYAPGAKSWQTELDFSVPVEINSQGLRGPEIEPKGERFRILMVGDSAIAASGVTAEESLPLRLESLLGPDKFEVLNGGFAAYSTVQELLFLQEQGLGLKPDLVILAFAAVNDIQMNYEATYMRLKQSLKRPVAFLDSGNRLVINTAPAEAFFERRKDNHRPGVFKRLLGNSVLWRRLKGAITAIQYRRQGDPNFAIGEPFIADFAPEYSTWGLDREGYRKDWAAARAVTDALILEMKRLGEENGARFALLVMPPKLQVDLEKQEQLRRSYPKLRLDLTRINRELADFSERHGILHLDPLPVIIEARDSGQNDLYFGIEDEHMTAKSHLIVARDLADKLRASALLPVD
jgi:hypothetical protein